MIRRLFFVRINEPPRNFKNFNLCQKLCHFAANS